MDFRLKRHLWMGVEERMGATKREYVPGLWPRVADNYFLRQQRKLVPLPTSKVLG